MSRSRADSFRQSICRGRRAAHPEEDVKITTRDDVMMIVFTSSTLGLSQGLDRIKAIVSDSVAEKCPKKILVDFHNVKFFSSQLLGLLLHIWQKLTGYGGRVCLSGIDPRLHRVFKITKLDKIFTFYPDTDAALEALRHESTGPAQPSKPVR